VSHSIFEGVGSGGIGAEEEELAGQVIWWENLQATVWAGECSLCEKVEGGESKIEF